MKLSARIESTANFPTCSDRHREKVAALGYPSANTSLTEDDVPTVFPVVDRASHRQAAAAKEPLPNM